MKSEIVQSLTKSFESYSHISSDIEFWYARDLQKLLGYSKWENFLKVIEKAIISCRNAGTPIQDHFPEIRKSIISGKGSTNLISDYLLTRYACYLIAQNGDSSKQEIAFAQTYFAVQTRKLELIQQRINDTERILAREKLAQSEKQLSGLIYEKTSDEKSFAFIRSIGDKALFGLATAEMKVKWKVPKQKPLADFAPTVVLKGKDFANELTVFNTKEKDLKSGKQIASEHQENNKIVRKAMLDRGIIPENLKPERDIKAIKNQLSPKLSKKSIK